ncbi:MAG TPA: COX15/CtaA family protein [Pirellulales bacterium]|nr:COX15/CtaA family protein [Pirellulales bacterium]
MPQIAAPTPSPWPHRLAVLVACATFPLIWVGGLVTTYDAGMAVPDWPTTYGYNLFLYPWQTWLLGPWDLFIEHGHRLLGATVGLLTIALAVGVWSQDERRWMKWLSIAAVGGVVLQGVLGGARVMLDERLLAQIHGCVGPAFFAFAAALATLTSNRWRSAGREVLASARLPRLATATAVIAYIQLFLGSQLRHVKVTVDASMFRMVVWFHLLVAAALMVHVVLLWVRCRREAPENTWLLRPANVLLALITTQLALGCGAWVVNYGWPAWLSEWSIAAGYVVRRESFPQATITTAHVATGSLILAVAVVIALRSWRESATGRTDRSTLPSCALTLSAAACLETTRAMA